MSNQITGNELFVKAIREDFVKAFPNMKYVDMETAFGGYPIAAVGFDDNEKTFVLKLALSGYTYNDIEVSLTENEIEIKNVDCIKTLFDNGFKTAFSKIKMSKFKRRYPIPAGTTINDIKASMNDGILTIAIKSLEKGVKITPIKTVGDCQ